LMERAQVVWAAGQVVVLAFVHRAQVPYGQAPRAGPSMAWAVEEYPGVVDVVVPLVAAGAGGVEWVSHMARPATGQDRCPRRLRRRMRGHSLRVSSLIWSSS